VLSHEGVLANICQLATVIDFTPSDKVLNPLPLYHSYSFTAGMMLCLLTGTKLFLYVRPLRYRAIPEIAYRRNCTYLFGTSTFLELLREACGRARFLFRTPGHLRRPRSSEPMSRAAVGGKVRTAVCTKGYGATECSPVIALSTPHCFKPGTVGRPAAGLDYRIEPVEGIERGGLLHLKGVQIMLGYYRYEHPGHHRCALARFMAMAGTTPATSSMPTRRVC
jgi:acyl-[acyl-carrier-protein]-phospholipid O-acyltransferase/long-chain-fatty-acid--[acyl-carrier-protein] ligase